MKPIEPIPVATSSDYGYSQEKKRIAARKRTGNKSRIPFYLGVKRK